MTYLLIPQISVKSACLKIRHSICLYLAYLANISTRSPLRSAGMLHGSRWCALSCVRLFRCEQVIHFIRFRCGNVYRPQFVECVLVTRWRISWTPGGQYITIKRQISQLLHTNECTHRPHPQRAHALIYIKQIKSREHNNVNRKNNLNYMTYMLYLFSNH